MPSNFIEQVAFAQFKLWRCTVTIGYQVGISVAKDLTNAEPDYSDAR